MVVRRWIFSCFCIVGAILYVITYGIQISHAGTLKAAHSRTTGMDNPRTVNLTSIEWAHAVNNQKMLNEALNSNVKMIEADIVMGTLVNDTSGTEIPVMGHPPANISDISLDAFLRQILEHNKQHNENSKGVKLDFKSTRVFNDSLETLNQLWNLMDYPIWLNADILKGPVNAISAKPVDAHHFIAGCKRFENATLSIGWTTQWGENYTIGSYSDNDINEMLEIIGSNNISSKHKITFPVRAGIAAHSLSQLKDLYKGLNSTNDVTLTIWSSKGDHVDIDKLRQLILHFGTDKVYLDVPEEVSSKLNLGNLPNSAVTSSFVNFSLISLGMLLTSFLLQRYTM